MAGEYKAYKASCLLVSTRNSMVYIYTLAYLLALSKYLALFKLRAFAEKNQFQSGFD